MDLHSFVEQAGAWLAEHAEPLTASVGTTKWADGEWAAGEWGVGSDAVEVFHDLTDDEERALLDRAMAWQREKFDAGYGALTWPAEPRPDKGVAFGCAAMTLLVRCSSTRWRTRVRPVLPTSLPACRNSRPE
jgi:hypothetical protein